MNFIDNCLFNHFQRLYNYFLADYLFDCNSSILGLNSKILLFFCYDFRGKDLMELFELNDFIRLINNSRMHFSWAFDFWVISNSIIQGQGMIIDFNHIVNNFISRTTATQWYLVMIFDCFVVGDCIVGIQGNLNDLLNDLPVFTGFIDDLFLDANVSTLQLVVRQLGRLLLKDDKFLLKWNVLLDVRRMEFIGFLELLDLLKRRLRLFYLFYSFILNNLRNLLLNSLLHLLYNGFDSFFKVFLNALRILLLFDSLNLLNEGLFMFFMVLGFRSQWNQGSFLNSDGIFILKGRSCLENCYLLILNLIFNLFLFDPLIFIQN